MIKDLDLDKLNNDYNSILERINRYKNIGGNKYTTPINTYKILIKEIENYISYIEEQISTIYSEISNTDIEQYKETLNLSIVRLNILLKKFILLKEQISSNIINNNNVDNNNIYNIDNKNELLEIQNNIDILKYNFKLYKDLQKKLNIKLDLDNSEENNMKKDLNFINNNIDFLKKYIKLIIKYIDEKSVILKYEINYINKDKIALDKEYILTYNINNDKFFKDLSYNIDGFSKIKDNYKLIKETISIFNNFKQIIEKNNIIDNNNFSITFSDIINIKEVKNFEELEKIKLQIKSLLKDTNILFISSELNTIVNNIYYIYNGINQIKENYPVDLFKKYFNTLGEESILKKINGKSVSDILKNKDIINNLLVNFKNQSELIKSHKKLIDIYNNEFKKYKDIKKYILNNISSIRDEFIEKSIYNFISDYENQIKTINFNIDILNINYLSDFLKSLNNGKNIDNDINKLNTEIDIYSEIKRKINNYSYNSYDSWSSIKDKIILAQFKYLSFLNNDLVKIGLLGLLEKKFNSSKSYYEKQQNYKSSVSNGRSSSSSSFSNISNSSNSWSSSDSSSSSSDSGSYGGSDSF